MNWYACPHILETMGDLWLSPPPDFRKIKKIFKKIKI